MNAMVIKLITDSLISQLPAEHQSVCRRIVSAYFDDPERVHRELARLWNDNSETLSLLIKTLLETINVTD